MGPISKGREGAEGKRGGDKRGRGELEPHPLQNSGYDTGDNIINTRQHPYICTFN